ncbi:DNA-binding transcriptional response regulator, NtrC family, contains REC, AAA-type ATPase, and a Fis-type DNA-binding domains [Singulisphaera sp. GP187]|uniref:sigma 54-interacting transcriptional regulator n=1 Tax=Singulisphaera sp. GP187 TaxID=1882752 RepID=UPI0009266C64|nr:sigma 54-interacting transcriptional regulator [Singulisphaera sp. GP187]SIN84611.1 DNA-binding transcriptional response regulator, NtrC family, contains REC, AAA-type ATPase, and a Fis-type DNA-binding domains [Singulisphaera sp. GP187]
MASLRNPSTRLESLWLHVQEPLFWLTADLRLAWVNRAWEELTGSSAEEVAGLTCRAHGPTRAGDLPGLVGSFFPPPEALGGQPASVRTLIIHSSGERRWRRIEFRPFHDERGTLVGLFGLVGSSDAPSGNSDAESQRLRTDLLQIRERLQQRHGFDSLIGAGPVHRRLLDQIATAAATSVPVLVVGEPGTGKRTVARTIHHQSARRQAPILPIDCASLPAEVLERELFGGEMTARLSLPEGSSLMIGDILDLPRDLQSRLVASLDPHVRLLAMTSGDPEAALQSERLRSDLYYALTTLVIRLRPLRERLEEIPLLAQHLLERANSRGGRQRGGFSEPAVSALLAYDWPGNLRELARVIDEVHEQATGDLIEPDDLPAAIRGHLGAAYNPPPLPPPTIPLDELLTQVERRLIESTLQRARQNKSRAAELLGISRPRLYRRIKELGLPDVPEIVDEAPLLNGTRSRDEG